MGEDSENRADEKKIIQELQINPKENINKIAYRCGFLRKKTLMLIRKLEKDKTIWGYSTVIDEEKLGLNKYLILIKRTYKPLSKERLETIVNGTIKQKFSGLGIDIERPDDKVVAFNGTTLLVAEAELADSLIHLAIDIEENPEGCQLIIIDDPAN